VPDSLRPLAVLESRRSAIRSQPARIYGIGCVAPSAAGLFAAGFFSCGIYRGTVGSFGDRKSPIKGFDMALPRARALVSRLEEEPHVNPSTGAMEFSLRDPDGYYVTISELSAA
jgi:hypothetical protein